jgi:hypothetical protein
MKRMLAIFAVLGLIAVLAWRLCFPADVTMAIPALSAQWDEAVYSLDADETLRFVPPPFTPQRSAQFMASAFLGARRPEMRVMFRVIGDKIAYTAPVTGTGTVDSAFRWCTHLYRSAQLEFSRELGQMPADGDWIVRDEAPPQRRLKALESILSRITGRKLAIERLAVERDVIIVRGKWDFHPGGDLKAMAFYLPEGDSRRSGWGTLADSFMSLERDLHRRIIDETEEPHPAWVYWSGRGFSNPGGQHESWRNEALAAIEKQTSLKFEQTRRVIPVWIVNDRSANTQPVSK